MTFPSVWAAILLDAPASSEELAAKLSTLGTPATITREGWLALPDGFLARAVAAPYPPDLFAHPGATDAPTRASAAYLEISGGGLDVDRVLFADHTARGVDPFKTSRFTKLERMAAWLPSLASLGEGVVLPIAAHRFVPWASWPREGAGQIFAALVTLARGRSDLTTRGLRLFGVPDMGIAIAGDAAAASRSLFDAAFEAAWRGFLPSGAARLEAWVDREAGGWSVARVADEGTWIGGGDASTFALRVSIAKLVGAHLFDDPTGNADDVGIGVFASAERRFASTLTLHRLTRAKGPLELVAFSPRLSRHAAFALRQVAAVVRATPDALDANHRVAIPALEPAGLAGVVLWPSGHIPLGGASVSLLEAFPITPAELARFRAGEQGAWMDEVEKGGAFAQLQARWCGGVR